MNRFHAWRSAPAADFAVIGDPVAHSLSPSMQMAAFQELGLSLQYVALHVPAGEASPALDFLSEMGYRGVNVTLPHKADALRWAVHPDALAQRIGAANTVDLLSRSCINTDAPGFIETLDGLPLEGRSALILGAGGSARAIGFALADAGWELRIHNRTGGKARQLAEDVGGIAIECPDPQGAALIVNTTSASLQEQAVPVLWRNASPKAVAYDLMYGNGPTAFVSEALKHELFACDGRRLLVAQGALCLEWWLGVKAPRDVMMTAIS